jgi:hypothetical protein
MKTFVGGVAFLTAASIAALQFPILHSGYVIGGAFIVAGTTSFLVALGLRHWLNAPYEFGNQLGGSAAVAVIGLSILPPVAHLFILNLAPAILMYVLACGIASIERYDLGGIGFIKHLLIFFLALCGASISICLRIDGVNIVDVGIIALLGFISAWYLASRSQMPSTPSNPGLDVRC